MIAEPQIQVQRSHAKVHSDLLLGCWSASSGVELLGVLIYRTSHLLIPGLEKVIGGHS